MAIEGKVALIIDEHNLVVNKGRSDGVGNGMAFVVVAQVDSVTDPDTDEDLGQWEGIKARLVAIHVQERLSILASSSPAKGSSSTSTGASGGPTEPGVAVAWASRKQSASTRCSPSEA